MDKLQKVKTIFQNLSDINRLKIVSFIGSSERSVGEVVEHLGLSQPLISHHLKKLRECGILATFRKGPFVYYRIKNPALLTLINEFIEINEKSYELNKK